MITCPVATRNGFSGQKWPCWTHCPLILISVNVNLQLVGNPACRAGTWQCPSPTPTPWGFRVQGTGSEGLGYVPFLCPGLLPDSQPSSTVTKGTHILGREPVMQRQEVGLSGAGHTRGGNCSPSGGRGHLPVTWGPPIPELQHGWGRDLAAPRPPPLPARDLSGDIIVPASWAAVGTIQHVLTPSLDEKVPWALPSLNSSSRAATDLQPHSLFI